MPTTAPVRHRNAVATRAAILASARAAFARAGYDGAGVREIAAGAGVTAMLVNRYFGSKEQLFAEVVADTMAEPVILRRENLEGSADPVKMAHALVAVTKPGAAPLDGFQIMLRSASNPVAAEIARKQIEKHHQKTLASALDGPHAAERASLVFALVAGLQVMRQMIGMKALTRADPAVLAQLLAPLLAHLLQPKR